MHHPHLDLAPASSTSLEADPGYGYAGQLAELRRTHMPGAAEDAASQCFLDHAGGTLASRAVLAETAALLGGTVLANPHSEGSGPARAAEWAVRAARRSVLQLAGLPETHYACVWTSGATGALRLLADSLPWTPSALFAPHRLAHNSLLGLRVPAAHAGAAYSPWAQPIDLLPHLQACPTPAPALIAAPLVCNFSGTRLPLDTWLAELRAAAPSCLLLVDAAAALGRGPLELDLLQPDYVAVSVQKALGWPAGVGALLVRRGLPLELLLQGKRRAFGGGAVGWVAWQHVEAFGWSAEPVTALEPGSLPYAALAAVPAAARLPLQLGLPRIATHLRALARFTAHALASLCHPGSGAPVCRLLGDPGGPSHAAGIVTFVLLRRNGSPVRLGDVQQLAALENITLRVGIFCNPGAAELYLGLSHATLANAHAAGYRCGGDNPDDTQPMGAIRASFGQLSSASEAHRLIDFVRRYFVADIPPRIALPPVASFSLRISQLYIYPIKSCAAFDITNESSWPLCPTGFQFDREFAVIDTTNDSALSLKTEPLLARIRPQIYLAEKQMRIISDGSEPLVVPLEETGNHTWTNISVVRERVGVIKYGGGIEEWFSTVLQRPATLVRKLESRKAQIRQNPSHCSPSSASPTPHSIALVNEGQFLVVSEESINDIKARIHDVHVDAMQFRPNFVLAGFQMPYEEDFLLTLTIGDLRFSLLGPCSRCMMVNIDPGTGEVRSREPLRTLASYRRKENGMIAFGVLMSCASLRCGVLSRISALSPVVADFDIGQLQAE